MKGRKSRLKAESGVGVLGEGQQAPPHPLGGGWPHVCREKFQALFKDFQGLLFSFSPDM